MQYCQYDKINVLLTSRGRRHWNRSRRCQRVLHRGGHISAWPLGQEGWKTYMVGEILWELL